MRPDDLNKLAREYPFRPFDIHTHSGETFHVATRDQYVVQVLHLVYQEPDGRHEVWIPLRAIAWMRLPVLEIKA